MKQPTKQDILDETDEQILNEWVAVFCMGYSESFSFPDVWVDDYKHVQKNNFNPCQYKAQAFDLMVKYELEPVFYKGRVKTLFYKDGSYLDSGDYPVKDTAIAIAKASLLSVIGEGV